MRAADPRVLASYRTDAGLAARQSIYRWLRRPVDLPGHALAALRDVTAPVADIGCGNGTYVARVRQERPDLQLLALDLSPGMLAGLRETTGHGALAVADAARLPLPEESIGAGLAMHMLYHLPNPASGVAELRRVIRPGGPALVASNARDDKEEFTDLLSGAFALVGAGPLTREIGPHNDLSLEALVPLLGRYFQSVEVKEWRTEIVVPEPAPVVAYVDSMRPVVEAELPGNVPWTAVLDATELLTAESIRTKGAFRMTGHVGMAVCR